MRDESRPSSMSMLGKLAEKIVRTLDEESCRLRFNDEAGWTYYPPTRIPYEDAEGEPEPPYSFSWPHDLIREVNVLILSRGMDPLRAIQAVEKKHLRKEYKH